MNPVERTQSADNLVWLDLEMTGLDPSRDAILQAGLIITSSKLEVLEEFACDIWQPESSLDSMVPFVRQMHETNGLLRRVRASTVDLAAAERAIMQRVAGWCSYPAVLCGNSIGQDKRFVEQHMAGLAGYLSYRVVDVSSLKVLARLWHGDAAVYKKSAEGAHDALVDIRRSILELAHYRATLFRD